MFVAQASHAEETRPKRLSEEEIQALINEESGDEPIDELMFLLQEDPAGFALDEDPVLAELFRQDLGEEAVKLEQKEAAAPGLDYAADLSIAFGYRTNVTLSAFDTRDSAFVSGAASVFLATDPTADWRARAVAFYERTAFLDLPDIDDEVLAYGSLRGERAMAKQAWGAQLQYVYLDQFFDASTSSTLIFNQRLQVHELTGSVFWNRDLADDLLLELIAGAERTEVSDSTDDLTAPFGSAEWVWLFDPVHGSTLEATTALAYEIYDNRIAREGDGTPRNQTVQLYDIEVGVVGNWRFDALPQAAFSVDAEARAQIDPQGGYYENFLWGIAGEVDYTLSPVTLQAYGGAFWRDYPNRINLASPPLVSTRSTTINAGASASCPINDWAEMVLAYDFDTSDSNAPASDFTAHTGSFSLNVTF